MSRCGQPIRGNFSAWELRGLTSPQIIELSCYEMSRKASYLAGFTGTWENNIKTVLKELSVRVCSSFN